MRTGLSLLILPALVTVSLSCGGGGGGGDDGPGLAFKCSDSPVAPDQAALRCGTKIAPDTWLLQVIIGGVTSSADISGLDFDVVFDASNLSYAPGSAQLGTLLSKDGDDPLLVANVASNDPGRLIIGVHRTNQPAGVQGTSPENLVLTFRLKTNKPLSSFGPEVLHFENAEVVDSTGVPISGMSFSDQLLLSVE